jgi:hypothetical protein
MIEHVHVSDLRWDRLLAGELSAEAAARVRSDAATCDACTARLAELTREHHAFAQQAIPIHRRRRWLVAVPALAAAAAIVVALTPRSAPEERVKGSGRASLLLTAGQRVLVSGDRLRPGDRLQAGYHARDAGCGAVLSRDGSRRATAYVPSRGEVMIALPPGEAAAFPESTILDDVTGEEIVVVMWCASQHALGPLLTELEARGAVAAPEDCTQLHVVLDKRAGAE